MFNATTIMSMVAALCFGTVLAWADERGTPDEQKACTPDVFRLCSAFIPDESRIVACLRQNRERLSPACKKVFS